MKTYFAKVGTMPGRYISILYKRKAVVAGDRIQYKTSPPTRGQKSNRGRVDRVDNTDPQHPIVFISKM